MDTAKVTLSQPSVLSASIDSISVTCYGTATGSANVVPSGGMAPYSYQWSTTPVQNSQTATGLKAGSYSVTVTDANGCSLVKTITITQPDSLDARISASTNILCFGNSTGSATVSVTGGNGGYSYAWTPSGGSSATATGLAAGNYQVTVTESKGCVDTAKEIGRAHV